MWISTLRDAALFQLPAQLRSPFVLMIVHNNVADPRKIYDRFKLEMSEDYLKRHNDTTYGGYR